MFDSTAFAEILFSWRLEIFAVRKNVLKHENIMVIITNTSNKYLLFPNNPDTPPFSIINYKDFLFKKAPKLKTLMTLYDFSFPKPS
jgi:hypothetical protein